MSEGGRLRELAGAGTVLLVHAEFERTVGALGLLERDRVAALFRDASGAMGRSPIAVLPLPGRVERLALRRLRHGGLFGPLLGSAFLGVGRARRELQVTAELRARGAPVPRPVLAVASRIGGPLWRAALATVFEEAAQDAVAFLSSSPGRAQMRRTCQAAGAAVRRFHDAGGHHPDLHVKNLLVRPGGLLPEVIVIDLDRARVARPPGPAERMAELMRLQRSLLKRGLAAHVGVRGAVSFLQGYTAGDRKLRRALLARLPLERTRLRLHALMWRAGVPRSPG
ncbi:MAG TPA: lipopolysaccharide kinase InaA family protein [Myxococcota bacterium]|nr:lipopolysaccharide kinase InaA family protein [Myxococcota bacterium]